MKTLHARRRPRPQLRAQLRFQVVRLDRDGGGIIDEHPILFASREDAEPVLRAWIAADRDGQWSEVREARTD